MSATVACLSCSSPLPIRQGKPLKFCPKCGTPVPPTDTAPVTTTVNPAPAVPIAAVPQPHVIAVSPLVPAPAVVPTVVPPDAQALESEEVAAWKWNWGAFLVPGIWPTAHRIRPKVLPLILLGVPIALLTTNTAMAIIRARAMDTAYQLRDPMVNENYLSSNWSQGTMFAGWLLALYALACLCSISLARFGTLNAWRNFQSQRLSEFRRAQQGWAIAGTMLCAAVVGTNIMVWDGYMRDKDIELTAMMRQEVLTSNTWLWRDATGKHKIAYRFLPHYNVGDPPCNIQIDGGSYIGGNYHVMSDIVKVSSKNSTVGEHAYKLSPDQQTLTEMDSNEGSRRVFRRIQVQ